MNNGWIKLHRSFLDWEWYECPNTARLFIHCLLKANHKDGKYKGDDVPRGTFLTSLELLSQQTGLSVKSVRTSLKHLEKTGEVGTKRARKGTRLTVCNYATYQSLELDRGTESGKEGAHEGHERGTKGATNKNDNNNNKENKFIPPSVEDVAEYCNSRSNGICAASFIDSYKSKGWMVGKSKMKDWKAAVRTWEKNKKKTEANKYYGRHSTDAIKAVIEKMKNQQADTKDIELFNEAIKAGYKA
jgi:hypothetical protein